MKFIDEKGKLSEGVPLTDEQVKQRERLIAYFHERGCEHSFHGSYSRKPCEDMALDFITGKIQIAADTDPAPEAELEQA